MNEIIIKPTIPDISDKSILTIWIFFADIYIISIMYILFSNFNFDLTKDTFIFIFYALLSFIFFLSFSYLLYKGIKKIIEFRKSEIVIKNDHIFFKFPINFESNEKKLFEIKISDIQELNLFKYHKTKLIKNNFIYLNSSLFKMRETIASWVKMLFVFKEGVYTDKEIIIINSIFDTNSSLVWKWQLKKCVRFLEKNYLNIKIEKSLFWSKEI